MATKAGTTPQNVDHRGKKIYDLKSKEARDILAKQKVQGYTPDFGYVEKADYLDLYIPVPEVRVLLRAACPFHVLTEIHGLIVCFAAAEADFIWPRCKIFVIVSGMRHFLFAKWLARALEV